MAIHEILLTVSLVTQLQAGRPVGTASSFFYENDNKLFLVTNFHVVKDDKKKIYPDTLRLRLHTDRNDARKSEDYDIPLYDAAGAPLWRTDAQPPEADVAVLQLDRNKLHPSSSSRHGAPETSCPRSIPCSLAKTCSSLAFRSACPISLTTFRSSEAEWSLVPTECHFKIDRSS